MPDKDSTTKFKVDISELKKEFREAQRQIQLVNSEFKAATAGMGKWSDSADGLGAKIKQLNGVLEAEESKLNSLQSQYKMIAAAEGESSKGAQELMIKINNQKAAVEKVRSSIGYYSDKLSDLKNESNQAETATDKLRNAINEQESELESLKSKYSNLVIEQGKSSKEAKDTAKEIQKLSSELQQNKTALNEAESAADKFDKSLDDMGDSADNAGDGFTVMKGAIANLVADGIQKLVGSLKDFALESDGAYKNFQAQTGASTEEMKKFRKEIDELYKNNYGESLQDIGDKMAYVKQVTGETDPSKIKELTENAIALEDTFGSDFNETLRGVQNLMNHFGISAEEAFDLFAKGSQEGLDYTDELGDNVAEYGGNFKQAGYSAEEYFQLLANGTKNGAYNLDKVNDSINEVKNRLGDGTIEKNIKTFSKGTQTAFKNWQSGKGTMKDVIDSIVKDINGCTDEQKALNMAATAFGTMGEDANLKVVKSLTSTGNAFKDVKGTMEDVKKVRYEDVKDQFSQLGRTVQMDLIAPLAQKALPTVKEFVTWCTTHLNSIIPIATTVGAVMATIFTVNKIATFISSLKTLTTTFGLVSTGATGAAGATSLLGAAMAALPYVAVAAGIAALVGAFAYYNQKQSEAIEKEYGLSKAQKQSIQNAKELKSAYDETNNARNQSMQSASSEYGYLSQLKSEYNGLIDSNGKVKKGYEDRANFILNQLAQSLGVEVSQIQKVINKNGELGKSIDTLIQKKKAEAILSANESAYTEAIQKRGQALTTYQSNLTTLDQAEQKYNQTKDKAKQIMEVYNATLKSNPEAAAAYYNANSKIIEANDKAKKSYEKAKKGVKDSEAAYVGYNSTIQNYEGLSSAIITGDSKKIASALTNMEHNFITAETGTKSSLQKQVKNMESNYSSLKKAIDNNTPGVTQKMVNQAKSMVNKSKKELDKFKSKASSSGKSGGKAYAEGVGSQANNAKKNGNKLGKSSDSGAKDGGKGLKKTGAKGGEDYASGVGSKASEAESKGKTIGKKAKEGAGSVDATSSGKNFSQGYIDGMGSLGSSIWTAAKNLAKKALDGLKKGQKEGSPSKLTRQSGVFFGEGYNNGINEMLKTVTKSATNMGVKAYKSLREAQQEGSPSKLTYKSGVNFSKGYINGIASQEKNIQKAVSKVVTGAVQKAMDLKGFDFSSSTSKASSAFSEALSSKITYTTNKMSYQNEQQIKKFDSTISTYQSKLDKVRKKYDKTKNKATKKSLKKQIDSYKKVISEQTKFKTAYENASSQMLSEFNTAMSNYQTQAQSLIDSTINGIATNYQAKYDDLISKQDTLISKLKSAGDLFEVSGAGIMTVNDIKQQTQDIKDYAAKLEKIKSKVSADLFDQIASYDMDQGGAFMDRLLALSDADLKAYSNAYDEKMKTSESLAKNIYKSDFDKVAKGYSDAVEKAFKNLPTKLEKLGNQAMKGFVNGLTTNTNFMSKSVKTLVKGMVNQFKKELKIHSPSKVMAVIGDYTGQGFGEGLLDSVKQVQKNAKEFIASVTTPLDNVQTSIGDMRKNVRENTPTGTTQQNQTIVNNYNLVQNNTSPKSLSALDTYRARRQQVSMVKAMTQPV